MMTVRDLWDFAGTSEELNPGTNDYYALMAIEYHGSGVRDNSYEELIIIGQQIEQGETE